MRNLFKVLAAGALALSIATPAFADPPRNGRGNGPQFQDQNRGNNHSGRRDNNRRDDRRDHARRDNRRDRDWNNDQRGRRDYADNRKNNRRYEPPRYVAPRYVAPRYVSPRYVPPPRYSAPRYSDYSYYQAPGWYVGQHIPHYTQYRPVNDWRHRRLPPPRRGHYYADVDGDVLLIAAATGLIVWALNN